jgi:hypothetical protein
MVLSINFYKIARNALKKRIKTLTRPKKSEKKDLYENIVSKKIWTSLFLCILIGWIIAAGLFILFASVLGQVF